MKKNVKLLITAAALLGTLSACENETPDTGTPDTNQATVTKVDSVTLNKATTSLYIGESEFLRATIAPETASDKNLEWTSSDEDVAMVAANGKVVGLKAGTATIKATAKDGSGKFGECVVTVSVKDTAIHVTDVTLGQTSASMFTNESLQLEASVTPENATEKGLVWTSSDETKAMVTSSGKVVALAEGNVTIKVASKEKPDLYKECAITITVKNTKVDVSSVTVSPKSINLDLGGTYTANPTVTVAPENATNKAVVWTSSDPTKVVVDSGSGAITAIAQAENVTITATSADDATKKDTIQVNVADTRDNTVYVESISLDETLALDLKDGATRTLTANVTPTNAWNKKVNWTSSDPTTVKVTPVGDTSVYVEGLKTGTATITGITEDGNKTKSCVVTVSDSVKHVTGMSIKEAGAETDAITIDLNDLTSVEAAVLPADADNQGIIWSIANADKEYVQITSTNGGAQTIIGKKVTTAPIKVRATSAEFANVYKEISVTVVDPNVYATGVSVKCGGDEFTSTSIEAGDNKPGVTLEAEVVPANTTEKGIEWSIFSEGGDEYVKLIYPTTDLSKVTVKGIKETTSPITLRATSKSNGTYKDVQINVVAPNNVTTFVDFSLPSDILKYKANIAANNLNSVNNIYDESNENMPAQFFSYDAEDADKATYVVGDQGTFEFKPSIYVYKPGENTPTTIANPSLVRKVYKYNASTEAYEEINATDYMYDLEDDTKYSFKSEAVGERFKLSFMPGSEYFCEATPSALEFEFKVIRGYNVDSLAKLSLFDNVQSAWNGYKNATGLTGVKAEGGIVLHKDIQMRSEILPDDLIYDENEVESYISTHSTSWNSYWHEAGFASEEEAKAMFINSPMDFISLFERNTCDEDFFFEGNFFSVDASTMKPVIRLGKNGNERDDILEGFNGDGCHSQIFGFNANSTRPSVEHTISIENLAVRGNGGLGAGALGKGGFMTFKAEYADIELENVISASSFMTLLTSDGGPSASFRAHFTADRLYAADAYSSVFYFYGSVNNTVKNSYMSKAGGALFILDEPMEDLGVESRPSELTCENVYAHNYVTGTEPWFAQHEGSTSMALGYIIAPGLPMKTPEQQTAEFGGEASMSGFIHTYSAGVYAGAPDVMKPYLGKTIGATEGGKNYCDFIALDCMISGLTNNVSYNLVGNCTINNGEETAALNMTEVVRDTTYGVTTAVPTTVANPIYKSSNGGTAYIDQGTGGTPVFPTDGSFRGNYCSIYLSPAMAAAPLQAKYFGVLCGMFDIPEKAM